MAEQQPKKQVGGRVERGPSSEGGMMMEEKQNVSEKFAGFVAFTIPRFHGFPSLHVTETNCFQSYIDSSLFSPSERLVAARAPPHSDLTASTDPNKT